MKSRVLVFISPFILAILIISSCATLMFKSSVYRGDYTNVKKYIEKGANVNDQKFEGYTALMIALKMGHKEIAKLLIQERVNVNIRDKQGTTALICLH
jgi:ankyrin repeat protein